MQEDTAFLRPRRPELPVWDLEVIRTEEVAPRMRRVVLTGLGLDSFHYRPGQALILRVPLPEGGIGRRDYTIRAFDRARHELAIDFLLHGETPAPNWARAARPGDRIEARGPRGRTTFAEGADWHLFLGDETCLPAILHILEEVPPGTRAFAFLEVANVFDQLPVETPADLTLAWIHRGSRPAGPGRLLLDRISAFQLPEGAGHTHVLGETSNVRAQRRHLLARGMTRE